VDDEEQSDGNAGGVSRRMESRDPSPAHSWEPQCPCRRAEADRWSLAGGRTRRSVSQFLDLAIVAHCVDVDPEKIPDSSGDPEGGRFCTGRITTANLVCLKPPSECRYDYIALVPLDFRRPVRHQRKSTPKRSRHFASRTPAPRPHGVREYRHATGQVAAAVDEHRQSPPREPVASTATAPLEWMCGAPPASTQQRTTAVASSVR
jgi:hypothetical protein